MRTLREIEEILDDLDERIADELEDQDLDFKAWDDSSRSKAIRTVIDWAICMANGGGGTVVFGVADRVQGRSRAVVGVPPEIDTNRLKLAVYDATDPKLTPVFEELRVPEGTGRLIVMQIHPGMPPHTDTAGRGTIRVGKDCKPLTGTLRRKIAVETGEGDVTATEIDAPPATLLSASAMEKLRETAARERAPSDLLMLGDEELLSPSFRAFVAEQGKRGVELGVDELLILQHLLRHPEVDSATAARLCQRSPQHARESLSRMERALGFLERSGAGRGTYWTLRADVHDQIAAPGDPDRDRQVDWEAAKTRVLSVLKQRAERGEPGLKNKEIRAITRLDRNQVVRLLRELRDEVPEVKTRGHGAGARYSWEGA